MPNYFDHRSAQEEEFTVNVIVTKKATNRPNYPQAQHLQDSTPLPPSYDSVKEEISARRRSGPRKEWDAVAARIAARTANTRSSGKRISGSHSPARIEKPSNRRHKPAGLSIDTNVAKPFGSPRQLFPKPSQKQQQTSGYSRLHEDERQQPVRETKATSQTKHTRELSDAQLVSKFSPETPSIIITPALDSRLSPERRARVASSVYSRLTSGATPPTESGAVPPLPQNLPTLIKKSQPLMADSSRKGSGNNAYRESTATAFEEDFDEKKPARVTSTDTLFEEDQYQSFSRLEPSHSKLSLDTTILPTPHRSRGWWDLIRTPFDNGKTFSKFGRSPTDGERTPDVPAIPPMAQQLHSNGLGLKFGSRQTHNSQALRRLESKDRLQVDTMPPVPKRSSISSAFSPNDREVPLMLQVSPVDKNAEAKAPTLAKHLSSTTTAVPPNGNPQSRLSPSIKGTPESVRSDFSPVGQVVGQGEVLAGKGVMKYPLEMATQSSNQNRSGPVINGNKDSLRSSFTAEISRGSPQIVGNVRQTSSKWSAPTPVPYFAPPPTQPTESANDAYKQSRSNVEAPFPPTRFSSFQQEKNKDKKKRGIMCGLFGQKQPPTDEKDARKKRKRKCCCIWCCLLFFILVFLAVILGVVLGRRGNQDAPTEATWFNITNFPPIPGGVLTVARPNLRTSVSGCVNPQAMWSCAVPKEQQDSIKPNDPDQPNFVLDIRYDNSTISQKSRRSGSPAASSWKRSILAVRDSPVFAASPKAPSLEEYAFLGKTTDNISQPFEGEDTPFYISFKPPAQADFRLVKRQEDGLISANDSTSTSTTASPPSATSSANFIPNLSTAFPKPAVNPDGTAEAANLLPFPSFQPLRLFNRGTPEEHYGFYTYFERSIFLRSVAFQNATQQIIGDVPADANGGSTSEAATARCTWTDTRFKVQIWTNKASTSQLLAPPDSDQSSSAQFTRPGSFPYPITFTLDRHGGGLTTKMLYCYGMNDREIQDINSRKFQPEDRGFGGTVVNPSRPFMDVPVSVAEGGPGGIDGGSGGCMCEWANWLSS